MEGNQAFFTMEMISDNDDFFNYLCEGGISEVLTNVQSLQYSLLYLSLKRRLVTHNYDAKITWENYILFPRCFSLKKKPNPPHHLTSIGLWDAVSPNPTTGCVVSSPVTPSPQQLRPQKCKLKPIFLKRLDENRGC